MKLTKSRRALALGACTATVVAGLSAFGIVQATADSTGKPINIILGVGTDESQKIISWYNTDGSTQQSIQISEGTSLGASPKTIVADTSANTVHDTEAENARYKVGAIDPSTGIAAKGAQETLTAQTGYSNSHVRLADLKPNTSYTYRVGASDGSGWSAPYTFSTGSANDDFTFDAFGDPQIGSSSYSFNDGRGWAKTLGFLASQSVKPELLVSTGDQVEQANNEWDWSNWADPHTDNDPTSNAISPVLKQFTYAPQIGNHEGSATNEKDANGKAVPTGRAYEQHFYPPNQDNDSSFFRTHDSVTDAGADGTKGTADDVVTQGSTSNRPGGNYWYTYKGVLFININSNAYTVGTNGVNSDAAHAAYIKDVIEEHGTGTKWQVVTFHHAIYSPADHANDADNSQRRKDLAYTMSQEGIDLVIQGHDHAYSRSYELKSSAPGTAPSKANAAEQPGAQAVQTGPGGVIYVTVDSSSGSKYYDLTAPDTTKNGGDYGPDPLDAAGNKNDANQTRHWANSVESQTYTPTIVQVNVTDKKLTVKNIATQNWNDDTNSAVLTNKAGQRTKADNTVFGDRELATLGDQRPGVGDVHHLQKTGAVSDQFELTGGNTNALPGGKKTETVTVQLPGQVVTQQVVPANAIRFVNHKIAVLTKQIRKAKGAKKAKLQAQLAAYKVIRAQLH